MWASPLEQIESKYAKAAGAFLATKIPAGMGEVTVYEALSHVLGRVSSLVEYVCDLDTKLHPAFDGLEESKKALQHMSRRFTHILPEKLHAGLKLAASSDPHSLFARIVGGDPRNRSIDTFSRMPVILNEAIEAIETHIPVEVNTDLQQGYRATEAREGILEELKGAMNAYTTTIAPLDEAMTAERVKKASR